MKTSPDGINLIKKSEALRLDAYFDDVGVPTIGYGHTGDVTPTDVTTHRHITEHQADAILGLDLDGTERGVTDLTKGLELRQGQFDALVSLAFNVGLGALAKSTLLRKLRAGDVVGAADEFRHWNHAGGKVLPGLTKRREAERTMFLLGI